MQLPPEDRHFRAFRRTGDPDELARVFDATAAKLLRVGVHLTRDLHAAEDLVQATFLTAIESAGTHRDDVPVLGWLLTILANRARHLRRQSGRRPDPARIAGRTAPDPVGDAAGRELSTELMHALGDLPVQYSQVLELHLVHGLDATEIARVLRRPGGTVRTQICRGLDQLRRALPTGLAVGGVVAVTTGRGLAMVRDNVLHAAAGRIATGATAAGLAGLGGMLLMKKPLLAVVAFAATAATAVLLWPPPVPSQPTGPDAPPTQVVAQRAGSRDVPAAAAPSATAPAPATNTATRDPVTTGTTGDVRLHCVWASDGKPAPDVLVWRYRLPRFQAAAAPIKFLSLLMHDAQPGLVADRASATLVVVPQPARFALHKLLVSQTRSVIQQSKGGKDLHQAALLLELLAEDRPDDLERVAAAFAESGPTVTTKVLRGLDAACKRWPEAGAGADLVRPILRR